MESTHQNPAELLGALGMLDARYLMAANPLFADPAALAFLQQHPAFPAAPANGGGKLLAGNNSFRIIDLLDKAQQQLRSSGSSSGSDKANTSGENDSLEDEQSDNGTTATWTSHQNTRAEPPPSSRSPTATPNGLNGSSNSKKARKARTIFTDKQLQELESMFEKHKYLSVQDRMDLAQRMGLTDTQVKTWYQNRRTKWKRQAAVGVDLLQEPANFAVIQNMLRTNPYWSQQFMANPAMFPFLAQRLMGGGAAAAGPPHSPPAHPANAANPFLMLMNNFGAAPAMFANLLQQQQQQHQQQPGEPSTALNVTNSGSSRPSSANPSPSTSPARSAADDGADLLKQDAKDAEETLVDKLDTFKGQC